MQKYEENISARVSGALQPILGVEVTVADAATGRTATLYSDNGTTQIAQPLVTNETGYFGFYAANGDYQLTFSSKQVTLDARSVKLYDPADDPPFTQTQAAAASGASKIGYGQRSVENKLGDTASLKDKGAKGDGTAETAINAALADGKVKKVTPGDYRYVETSTVDPALLDFEKGADFVGMGSGTTSITARDVGGNVYGIQHNHNEQVITSAADGPITTGRLLSPPLSNKPPASSVDILAHWYNDFGLECVRAANGAIGSLKWYDWRHNHTTATADGPYDPKRHPMMGWYRGDDPVVLDRICYDLREYGVRGVILDTSDGFDTDLWASPTDTNRGYWLYQLFNNVKNFKGLGYIINGPYGSSGSGLTQAQLVDRWNKIVNLYLAHQHFYTMNIDGGMYPVIYLFDAGVIRTAVFTGATQPDKDAAFESWLKGISTTFKSAGYAGVVVMVKNGSYYTSQANAGRYAQAFAGSGVVMFESSYAWNPADFGNPVDYPGLVNNFASTYAANTYRVIPNVMTSRESKGHPSNYTTTGSTPELFGKVLRTAALAAKNNKTIPAVVTVYNVSEWAEGGAGLIANQADKYGYLEQLRTVDAFASKAATDVFSYKKQVNSGTTTAGNNIKPIGSTVRIYASASVTLNSTYLAYTDATIAPGYDSQEITLVNSGDAGWFFIRLCDVSNYSLSGLYLKAPTIDLYPGESIRLRYILGIGWVQQGAIGMTEAGASPTTGFWKRGARLNNTNAAVGSPKGWMNTNTGGASSTTRADATAYTVGTWAKWSTGTTVWECTTAGTSTTGAPDITGKTVGQTVADGTVVWTMRATTQANFVSEGNL